MKITVGQAHGLFVGLSQLDKEAEKLSGATRLKIAINLNLLQPVAAAYERTSQKALVSLNAQEPKLTTLEVQAKFAEENEKSIAVTVDLGLKKLSMKEDIKLDDEPKVSSSTISQLLPLVTGVE